MRRLTLFPPIERPEWSDDGLYVDTRKQRYICDCARCIRDNLDLLTTDVREDLPAVQGIRCVHLPLGCLVSTADDRYRLRIILEERPAATYVVCSCERCGAHRNLVKAFLEARRVTPQKEQETHQEMR